MLKSVQAKGLKGLEFNQDLSPKTLFVGPNGSGKSSRALAAILSILGYVPGTSKKNPDILKNYGANGKLTVGVRMNGTLLNRQWKETKKGTVTEVFLVDTKKTTKDNYIAALTAAGAPRIFDIYSFMALSDQKKIDWIFALFPPAGDVNQLDSEIEDLKEKINSKRGKIRESENFVAKLLADRAGLNLPAGTLAETSGRIKSLETELIAAQSQLKKVEVEIAQEEAAKKAEQKAKEEADKKAEEERKAREKEEAEAKKRQEQKEAEMKEAIEKTTKRLEESEERNKQLEEEAEAKKDYTPVVPYKFPDIATADGETMLGAYRHEAQRSIKTIIEAIKKVNCPVCVNGVGMMTARKELNRWTKEL